MTVSTRLRGPSVNNGGGGGRVENGVLAQCDAMNSTFSESSLRIGVTVAVAVTQHEHAARLASLIQDAGDDVPIFSNREVARRTRAFREHRRAKSSGQLDRLIASSAC